MKQILLAAMLLGGILAGCTNSNKQTTDNNMEQKLTLTQEWDKGQGVPTEREGESQEGDV